MSDDEALLQLDRELDQRIHNLCGKFVTFPASSKDEEGAISDDKEVTEKEYVSQNTPPPPDKTCVTFKATYQTLDREIHTKGSGNSPSQGDDNVETIQSTQNDEAVEATNNLSTENCNVNGNDKNPGEDSEELEEADGVFDEFLDQSTRFRIKTLSNRVVALSDTVKVLQAECKSLAQAKQEAVATSHATDLSKRNLSKQLQTSQQDLLRCQKSNKSLQDKVKELTSESHLLRKELSGTRQKECENKNAQSSIHAQLMRSRADNASLREQLVDLKQKHKDEVNELRDTISNNNAQIREFGREQRNYIALVKKQEMLIRVLNEQKANIGIAKAAACLEEKFLSVISPLQPP